MRPALLLALLPALLLAAADPVHPAPEEDPLDGLAAAATAEARSRAADRLLANLPPAELERRLAAGTAEAGTTLSALAATLAEAPPALLSRLEEYLAAVVTARSRPLAARPETGWTEAEIAELLRLGLLDPPRFVDDPAFRERALGVLERCLDRPAPPALRDRLLEQLGGFPGLDFAAGERIAWAWGAVPRRSSLRRLDYAPGRLRFDADDRGSLAASVYSLPASLVDAGTAGAFLAGVRAAAPGRRILALTGRALAQELAGRAAALRIDLLPDHGRAYSPWPRDPLSLVRDGLGRVVILVRPNLQPGREGDADLGAELVQDLPADLDRAWGEVRLTRSPVPFHNGQVLLTPGAAWVSLHTLEPRILALLGETRVPLESFAALPGIERYLRAAHTAAGELGALYGRPVRFVHPLPETGSPPRRAALLATLGGGAGYDLDSFLTLLPETPGAPAHALVGDVGLGRVLLGRLGPDDWRALATVYGLRPGAEALPAEMLAAQRAPRPEALGAFLDLVAAHLAGQGFAVVRLPLVFVPVPLLGNPEGLPQPDFLLTWNNVVVEAGEGRVRAEGFASLVPTADALVRDLFARAGVRLDLLPPLVASIVRNGGYRCASNHLRRQAPAGGPSHTMLECSLH